MASQPLSDHAGKRSHGTSDKLHQIAEEDQPTASCTTDEESSYYSSKTSDLSLGAESLTFYTAVGYNSGLEGYLPENNIRKDPKAHAEQIKQDPLSQKERELEENTQLEKVEGTSSSPPRAETSELLIPDGHRYRFIFKQYWNNQRGDGSDTEVPHQICFPSLAPQTRDGPDFSEERRNEAAYSGSQAFAISEGSRRPADGRRSIFGQNCYKQYPTRNASEEVRTKSSPSLSRDNSVAKAGSLKSSLRPCRYSGEFRRTASTENMKRVVSFSDLTEVSMYEKPVEQYAHQAWASFFS